MPTREAIEQFNEGLITIADESVEANRRGEAIEPIERAVPPKVSGPPIRREAEPASPDAGSAADGAVAEAMVFEEPESQPPADSDTGFHFDETLDMDNVSEAELPLEAADPAPELGDLGDLPPELEIAPSEPDAPSPELDDLPPEFEIASPEPDALPPEQDDLPPEFEIASPEPDALPPEQDSLFERATSAESHTDAKLDAASSAEQAATATPEAQSSLETDTLETDTLSNVSGELDETGLDIPIDYIDDLAVDKFGEELPLSSDTEQLNPAQEIIDVSFSATGTSGFSISESDYERMLTTLSLMPLNVRIAAEEVLAEQRIDLRQIRHLIQLLVRGSPAPVVARHLSRAIGKRLVVPRRYQTGKQFAIQQRSVAYRFKTRLLPVIATGAAVTVVIGVLTFLSWRFVYRPARAFFIYEQALAAVEQEAWPDATTLFNRATDVHRSRRRYYQFAEALIERRQLDPASEAYALLLQHFPYDRRGTLDWAAMELELRTEYQRTIDILRTAIDADSYDYDVLAAEGDAYMAWADETTPDRYENARLSYTQLLQEFGDRDLSLMRMLHYFIRTDNRSEVDYLRQLFETDDETEIDPYTYAELGGYLIDQGERNDIETILFRALDADTTLPEPHYHLARYWRTIDDPIEEERALRNTLLLLNEVEPLTKRRTAMRIDTYGRIAEEKYREGDFITSERNWLAAIDAYETALTATLVRPQPIFGRLYAGLGDISFYVARDYDSAFDLYEQAEQNTYRNDDLDYRQGYILYRRNQFDAALEQFAEASGTYSNNWNILYAQANTFFNVGSYAAATSYYAELLDYLERRRDSIDNLLVDDDIGHRSLIEYLIKVNNNLGISLSRLSTRQSDSELLASGLVHLTESNELAVNYGRDRRTSVRAEAYNLAQINTRALLYAVPRLDTRVYLDIPEDLEALLF